MKNRTNGTFMACVLPMTIYKYTLLATDVRIGFRGVLGGGFSFQTGGSFWKPAGYRENQFILKIIGEEK